MSDIDKKIKELIKVEGLKVGFIAKLLGISRQTLSTWIKQNKPEQIEAVKKAIRKSQINNNSNLLPKEDSEIIKTLQLLVKSQEKTIELLEQNLIEKEKQITEIKDKYRYIK